MYPLLIAALSLAAGDAAPPLNTLELLQRPPAFERAQMVPRNRPTVIEFWATLCAPCAGQIPRWNALAERFRGQIEFIAITADDPDTVASFLKKRPMAGWIALDPDGLAHSAYGVASLPYTFLVDAHGVVRGVTTLSQLRESDLESLAAERKFAPPPPPGSG